MNEKKIIEITPAAVNEAKRRIEEKKKAESDYNQSVGLRLGIKGGGCSGLSYRIEIDSFSGDDYVSNEQGFMIIVDRKSSLYLKDVKLDYVGGFMGSGFKFINPNVSNTCGCGESFSV